MLATLSVMQACWQPLLDKAEQDEVNRLECLAEAIRISAHFHPLFHFFESALNTELAILKQAMGQGEDAKRLAKRALFLEHDNQTARAIMAGEVANVPPYDKASNSLHDWIPSGVDVAVMQMDTSHNSMFAMTHHARSLALKADEDATTSAYQAAIEQTEQTHKAYHIAASKPWLHRAQYFQQQAQTELANNDLNHARNLDPTADLAKYKYK